MTKERRLIALKNQIRRVEAARAELERVSLRFSWVRLLIVLVGFITAALGYLLVGPWLAAGILAPTAVIFVAVLILHGRVEQRAARHRIWAEIKRAHLARANLEWAALPSGPAAVENALELDLDLAGEYSLLRLIDSSVTTGGERRLRQWLSSSEPQMGQVLFRQRVVRELASRPLFRDKLALHGLLAGQEDRRWHTEDLLAWLEREDQTATIIRWLVLSAILAAINLTLFALDYLAGIPPIWQASLLVYFGLFLYKSRELEKPFRESSHLRDALEQLSAVFKQLEEFNYGRTPNLKDLCQPFLDPDGRPSKQLARVKQVVGATGIRGNPILWLLLNLVVPWDFYFAYLTAVRKKEVAALLPGWMEVWYQIEALSSLANLAYLNPHYTFPSFLEGDAAHDLVFKAESLGHPLLSHASKICNYFTAASLGDIALFTGSNMSGKSTFLRAVGINLALAFAGGPVDAALLETIPFRLFTCIRISDSVTDGISYFYAEVKCLRALLEELRRDHPLPLFYFIDEIFRGTNNRERLLGSGAYIQAIAGQRGIGLIATHDLELIHLAGELSAIKNYHFTDEIVDGRMHFDYKLRLGPSPTTNALKIMEMEGLPVP